MIHKRLFIPFLIALLTQLTCFSQEQFTLTEEEAKEDLEWLRFSLEYTHPRLYKYDDRKTVDERFDSAYNSIEKDISGLDFLKLVSKLNASVKCGHLYTIPQSEIKDEIISKKVLPFNVKVSEGDLFIFQDGSKRGILNGSKIISINGRTSSEIYESILEGIAVDGNILTRKDRLIERTFFETFHGFDFYYHLHIDRSSEFELVYLEYGSNETKEKTIQGISTSQKKERIKEKYSVDPDEWFNTPSPAFHLVENGDYGVLTISRSFYNDEIDPDYDSLLQNTFSVLKEKEISNLIIDLRNNEGGSEHHQMELISYLYDQPFKLYQNIYQSHIDFRPMKEIILERDTSQLLFNNDDEYMRRFSHDLWINNYEYSSNLRLQPPKENVFNGQIYVLMNGITFSSAADLAADIRKTTDATFIGEESGGTFEGPTGGTSIVVQLPNSKIMVRISPNIQIGYMYQKHPIGRGVLPDFEINYTVQDIIDGKDLEMEKALELIGTNK